MKDQKKNKKRSIYNKIKYGLLEVFPKEHPNFSIDNENLLFTYGKTMEGSGKFYYGEIRINKDNSVYLWIFLSRDSGYDLPILDYTWDTVEDFLGDRIIDKTINELQEGREEGEG